MEQDERQLLRDVRDLVKETRAEIGGKLDYQSKAFQEHLIKDAESFTSLKIGQEQLQRELAAAEQRRKEESEKRMKRVEAERSQVQAETLAQKAGRWAMWAAISGSLVLWVLEHFFSKK